jgi:hypothetical protein
VKHVPNWFPFAKFKLQAAEWRLQLDYQADRPLQQVKFEMVRALVVAHDVG